MVGAKPSHYRTVELNPRVAWVRSSSKPEPVADPRHVSYLIQIIPAVHTMAWTSSTLSSVCQWCAMTVTVSGKDVGTCAETHIDAALFSDFEPFAAATWRFEETVFTHGAGWVSCRFKRGSSGC
jgi:hypothetical protein